MFYLAFVLLTLLLLAYFWIKKSTSESCIPAIHLEREKANAPKILYLRAFNVDSDDSSNGNISIMHLLPKELDLANALIKLPYHLVAVGRPDEELPEIGFDRKKFEDSVWHTEVMKLMEESKLIIWRPDYTVGVMWEFGKLLELDCRHKVVVWTDMGYEDLQAVQKARYNVFTRKVFEQFSEQFPPFDRYKKFLVSEAKDNWTCMSFLNQTPIYKKIAG
jgi:hypothetical protein